MSIAPCQPRRSKASDVERLNSSTTAAFLQQKPDSKKLALANRSGFGDKAAANGGGIRQNNSDRRRRARRNRSSHAQFAQGGFHHLDGARWRCWTAQSSDAKSRLYHSRSDAAENAWLGDLQNLEKRSCNPAHSDLNVDRESRRDRPDRGPGIWRRRLCDETL